MIFNQHNMDPLNTSLVTAKHLGYDCKPGSLRRERDADDDMGIPLRDCVWSTSLIGGTSSCDTWLHNQEAIRDTRTKQRQFLIVWRKSLTGMEEECKVT